MKGFTQNTSVKQALKQPWKRYKEMYLNAVLTLLVLVGSSSHSFPEGCISSKLLLECALKCTKFNLPVDFTRKKGKCCCQQNDDKNKHYAIIKGKIICL